MAQDGQPKSSESGSPPSRSSTPESVLTAAAATAPSVLEHRYEPAEASPDKHPIKRPVILSIEILDAQGNLLGTTRGLVDSGADMTTLPLEWAQELGIDINDDCVAEEVRVVGPHLVKHHVYQGGLTIRVLGEEMFLPLVKFADGIGFACLGRRDFFDRYVVVIDHRNLRFFTERLPDPEEPAGADGDEDPDLAVSAS